MSKADLINALAEKTGLPKVALGDHIDTMFAVIIAEIRAGREVRIPNLGTFRVKNTNAREGRNPKTGEALKIPAGKKVHFKASKGLVG